MVESYIGIGSNLGNKEENIRKAIKLIRNKSKILKISSLYKTEPVGYKGQDNFLNAVVLVETELSAKDLLLFLQSIEKELKRVKTVKNGPRTIDLDILFYNNLILDNKDLIIPHPRLHERKFVLVPFVQINPNFVHPIFKKSITELYSELDSTDLVELYKKY